jgi:hypothetical protein
MGKINFKRERRMRGTVRQTVFRVYNNRDKMPLRVEGKKYSMGQLTLF